MYFLVVRIMEPSHGTRNASESATEDLDFISNMPDIVITNILDRLPTRDAISTSILSRDWRFKWTLLSRLVFDKHLYEYLSTTKHGRHYQRIISRLLPNLRCDIIKFVLYTKEQCYDEDIAHWLLFLSTKGVKDLTIFKWTGDWLENQIQLSSHVFSCLKLKHLDLYNCCFELPARFHGFPNLLSLKMGHVKFNKGNLGEFISQCPLLEILDVGVIHRSMVRLSLVFIL